MLFKAPIEDITKQLEKLKIEGLYFEIFEEGVSFGLGVFCCKNENDEVVGGMNEVVVGSYLVVGFHGQRSQKISEILDVCPRRTWIQLKTEDNKTLKVVSLAHKYDKHEDARSIF
jgi:hypothetical protein